MIETIVNSPYFIIVVIALALLLPRIPVVGKFFNVLQTAIHELGHALTTIVLGGRVQKIELFQDTSGTAYTQNNSRAHSAITAFMGYPFAAITSYIPFFLIEHRFEKGLILSLMVILLFMLILWIRNLYGAIWVILFIALNLFLLHLKQPELETSMAKIYAVFIAVESLSSSFIILCLSFRDRRKAGDTTLLQQFTKIPAPIWGLLFFVIALGMSYIIFDHFFLEQL